MKILITGDFCPIGHREKGCFDEVVDYFKECDLRVVNFECAVYADGIKRIPKEGPVLGCTEDDFPQMKELPIDLLTLANNHTYDYGKDGLKRLLEIAKKEGFSTVGAGLTLIDARTPFYYNIEKQSLAVINCCESEFSIADTKRSGANAISPIAIYHQIQEAKKIAKTIIVIAHGGHEYYQLPSPRMQELYRFFIEVGADAVIGHHPHCYSGMEKYRNGYIFYSLGNFYFDNGTKQRSSWHDGYMLKLTIDDTYGRIFSYEIIPFIQSLGKKTIRLMKGDDHKQFTSVFENLSSIIADEVLLADYYNKYVLSMHKKVLARLLPYNNHYLLALYKRGLFPSFLCKSAMISRLNALQCEAHRDITIETLKRELD